MGGRGRVLQPVLLWCKRPGHHPGLWVMPHEAIVMFQADKTSFLTIMGSQMLIFLHTRGQVERLADGFQGEKAVEINPFAAVLGPGAAAKRLLKPRLYNRLL